MAVAVRPTRRTVPARTAPLQRAGVSPWTLVAGLVVFSAALRTAIGWLRETPIYLGDEYLYAALGRSLAESGRPLVRGASADFPALLQPIVTAPAWLVDDVGIAYHLVQLLGAVAMSLAAVPAYWLARRVGLSQGIALAVAALALALPDLVYAGWVIAEPFAYPLALGAVAAGVTALSQPSRRSQLLFVALAGLAAFARIQFLVLPACFLAAALIVGARERRLRAALREQLLPLAVMAVPVALTLVVGPARVLAFYGGVVDTDVDPAAVLTNSGRNLFVLLFAFGFVLAPGALLGLALALARPRTRAELAFAALTVVLTAGLLVEAGLLGDADQAQERYLFYVVPLAAVGFGLYASRGWPHRLYHALAAAGLVTVAAVVPLSGYAAAEEKMHSPLLYAVFRIETWLGSPGSGSLAIALAATVLTAVVVVCSRTPKVATKAAFAAALVVCACFSTATVVFDLENTSSARASFFHDDPSWVDSAALGDVTLVRSFGGQRGAAFQQLFWNRSVDRVVLMPGASEIDPFPADPLRIARDGSLSAGGEPLTGPLLLDEHLVTIQLRGARHVASAPGYHLYAPVGTPRVALVFAGRHHDGWLGGQGSVTLWPQPGRERVAGTFFVDLVAPPGSDGTPIEFRAPGGRPFKVRLRSDAPIRVRLPVCSAGPIAIPFRAQVTGYVGSRPVSVRSAAFRFVPWRGACQGTAGPSTVEWSVTT